MSYDSNIFSLIHTPFVPEESLAELHAGSPSPHSASTTALILFSLLTITEISALFTLPFLELSQLLIPVIFIAALAPSVMTQGLTDKLYMLLPT